MDDLKNKTNEELMEIMRNSIENSYVPSSVYNKAKLELDFRSMSQNDQKSPITNNLLQKLNDIKRQIEEKIDLDEKGFLERQDLHHFRDDIENSIRSFVDNTDTETKAHFKKITSGYKNVPKPGFTNRGEAKSLLSDIIDFIDQTINRLGGKDFKTETYVSAGRPFDGRIQLENLFDTAQNEIFIVDSYLQKSILPILAGIMEKRQDFKIKFLIGNRDRSKFDGFTCDLPDFSKQYPLAKIEVKQQNSLHDRFVIIDGDFVYIVGSSLDNIGTKGNFISTIRDSKSKADFKLDIDSLWNSGTEIFKN